VQGSTVARQASEKERAKDLPTYKDNDFLNDRRVICVGTQKPDILAKIHADTEVGLFSGRPRNVWEFDGWLTGKCREESRQRRLFVGNESVPKIVINDSIKFLSAVSILVISVCLCVCVFLVLVVFWCFFVGMGLRYIKT